MAISGGRRPEAPSNIVVVKPTKPEDLARQLHSFEVTHESVVATAIMRVDESHDILRIWWGDEAQGEPPETIDLRKERLYAGNEAAADVLRLQHAYDATTKRRIIIVQSQDRQGNVSFDSKVIDLEPAYTFTLYPVRLEFNEHPDTAVERDSELDVWMKVHHIDRYLLSKRWPNEIVRTNVEIGPFFPIFHTLDGSAISFEMKHSDPPVGIRFWLHEKDNLVKDVLQSIWELVTVEFDTSTPAIESESPFHPRNYVGPKEFRLLRSLQDTIVTILVSTDISLIVPLDPPQKFLLSTE